MSKISRRDFGFGGLAIVAGLGLGTRNVEAQATPTDPKVMDPLEKLIQDARDGNKQSTQARMRFKLEDCSEPCFTYIPATPEGR